MLKKLRNLNNLGLKTLCLCIFIITPKFAMAITSNTKASVDIYSEFSLVSENLYKVTLKSGTLHVKEGFIPIGNFPFYAVRITDSDATAISGKPVMKLDSWISLENSVHGYYSSHFTKSSSTYTINGVPYVIVSVKGQSVSTKDTKPTLNAISAEYDAEVGQLFSIPLSVVDAEQDPFAISGSFPKGGHFSAEYPLHQIPTKDFEWTPTEAQANQVYTVKFFAKETASKKLSSNIVTAKIRVWPTGGESSVNEVTKFTISTATWSDGLLNLTGNVTFNKIMSAAQKTSFLANPLDVDVYQGTGTNGLQIGLPIPLHVQANGNWSLTGIVLPATPNFACTVTLAYDGRQYTRSIKRAPSTCIPPK